MSDLGPLTYMYGAFIDVGVFLVLLFTYYPDIPTHIYRLLFLQMCASVVHVLGIGSEIVYLSTGAELIASANYHLYVPTLFVILVLKFIVFGSGEYAAYRATSDCDDNRGYTNV